MTGSVDQVEGVFLAIACGKRQANCLALDGNPSLAFDFHAVKELVLELTLRDEAAQLDHPVGKGRFAMIYVSNDTKVSDMFRHG